MLLLDTSTLTSLFLRDANSALAAAWSAANPGPYLLSDWAAAEFGGAVTRQTRIGDIAESDALRVFQAFDGWRAVACQQMLAGPAAIGLAETLTRNFAAKLAAADALHIAIAHLVSATLVTFDARQAAAANLLGVACVVPP